MTDSANLRLEVRRVVNASPERLFEAWTTPSQLLAWWGPRDVRCTQAELDLQVGGRYEIRNELPDGRVVLIRGEFLSVDPPSKLVYTWSVGHKSGPAEIVTVCFRPCDNGSEVVVVHERIPDESARGEHSLGWVGCLDGLTIHVQQESGTFRTDLPEPT